MKMVKIIDDQQEKQIIDGYLRPTNDSDRNCRVNRFTELKIEWTTFGLGEINQNC